MTSQLARGENLDSEQFRPAPWTCRLVRWQADGAVIRGGREPHARHGTAGVCCGARRRGGRVAAGASSQIKNGKQHISTQFFEGFQSGTGTFFESSALTHLNTNSRPLWNSVASCRIPRVAAAVGLRLQPAKVLSKLDRTPCPKCRPRRRTALQGRKAVLDGIRLALLTLRLATIRRRANRRSARTEMPPCAHMPEKK
jgi:hypothetical protein